MAVDIRLWLSSFNNQRHLAHQTSIFLSGALMVTGTITFIVTSSSDFGNHDDFKRSAHRGLLAWSCGAVGMASLVLNVFLYTCQQRLESYDSSATEEQMEVRRTGVAVVGCICLLALAVGLFVYFSALVAAAFVGPSILVFLVAFMALITTCYDAASILRKGRIKLDGAYGFPLTVDEFDA